MKLLHKFASIFLLTFFSHHLYAANRFWVASAPGNWSNMANWSATSGGPGGASVPGTADAVTFNAGSLKNCIINMAVDVKSINITAAYTGMISQGNNALTISGAAIFTGGTFSGGTADIIVTGAFTLSGTLFTATSGILELNNNAAFNSATFLHNNGTVKFNGINSSTQTTTGTVTPSFYNLEYVGLGKTYNITSTGHVQVANSLIISGSSFCNLNTAVFDVAGDINISNTATGGGGTAMINMNGTGYQNLNGASSAGTGVLPQLTFNNPTGSITMTGYPGVANNFTYTAGIINPGVSTFCFARGSASTYTISGSPTLGNIAVMAATSTLTVTIAGMITATGDFTLAGGSNITINTGTIAVNGDISLTNTATGGGGTGQLLINGSGTQQILSTGVTGQSRLPDVTISKASGTLILPSLITVIGDWTYTSGGLDVNSNNSTIVFANTLALSGTHTLNNVTFEATANRTVTFTTGTLLTIAGTLTTTGASAMTLNTAATAGTVVMEARGNITINNSGAGGGTAGLLINGSGPQQLSSSVAAGQGRMPYITIQKTAGTLLLDGIISESRNWTYLSGNVDAVTQGSTVVFGGNNLTITSIGMDFYNTAFTANTSTLTSSLTVKNNLMISGTGVLAPAANAIFLSGNWDSRGTAGFTESTSTVNFIGSTLQTISSAGGENFTNIIINNGAAGVQLIDNVTVGAGLTMTAGNIDLNGNGLTLGLTATSPGTLAYTNGSIINTGSFTRWLRGATTIAGGSATGLFPFGTAGDKRLLYVSAPTVAPTSGGTISVSYNDATSNSAVTFSDGVAVVLVRKDLNWTISTAHGLAGGTYNLQVQGTGYGSVGNVADLRLTLVNSVTGTAGINSGTITNPQVNRTAITAANLNNTFYLSSVSTINSPLPVTLIYFTAKDINHVIKLDWETSEEFNNAYFTIQRSGNDITWQDVAVIPGKNNSSLPVLYTAVDNHPLPGNSFYRLMQTDIDGKRSYSTVRKISMTQNAAIRVYPTPASSAIYIESAVNGKMKVSLLNSQGQTMNAPVTAGIGKTILAVSSLPAGLYYLQVQHDNMIETKSVMILK